MTNEISQYPLYVVNPTDILDDGVCVMCEFAMQYLDKAIGDKKSRDQIEREIHGMCNHLPKTVSKECNNFVDKYADAVLTILTSDVSPKEVCTMLGLCKVSMKQIRGTVVYFKEIL